MPNAGIPEDLAVSDRVADLLVVRRSPAAQSSPDRPASSQHLVLCPMLRQEVIVQRCDFCPHGHEWIHDQVTDAVMLRCSYLARDA